MADTTTPPNTLSTLSYNTSLALQEPPAPPGRISVPDIRCLCGKIITEGQVILYFKMVHSMPITSPDEKIGRIVAFMKQTGINRQCCMNNMINVPSVADVSQYDRAFEVKNSINSLENKRYTPTDKVVNKLFRQLLDISKNDDKKLDKIKLLWQKIQNELDEPDEEDTDQYQVMIGTKDTENLLKFIPNIILKYAKDNLSFLITRKFNLTSEWDKNRKMMISEAAKLYLIEKDDYSEQKHVAFVKLYMSMYADAVPFRRPPSYYFDFRSKHQNEWTTLVQNTKTFLTALANTSTVGLQDLLPKLVGGNALTSRLVDTGPLSKKGRENYNKRITPTDFIPEVKDIKDANLKIHLDHVDWFKMVYQSESNLGWYILNQMHYLMTQYYHYGKTLKLILDNVHLLKTKYRPNIRGKVEKDPFWDKITTNRGYMKMILDMGDNDGGDIMLFNERFKKFEKDMSVMAVNKGDNQKFIENIRLFIDEQLNMDSFELMGINLKNFLPYDGNTEYFYSDNLVSNDRLVIMQHFKQRIFPETVLHVLFERQTQTTLLNFFPWSVFHNHASDVIEQSAEQTVRIFDGYRLQPTAVVKDLTKDLVKMFDNNFVYPKTMLARLDQWITWSVPVVDPQMDKAYYYRENVNLPLPGDFDYTGKDADENGDNDDN